MTVTLATHCHARDFSRLIHTDGLESLILGHNYPFDEIIVVLQRCGDMTLRIPKDYDVRFIAIGEEDYPAIVGSVGIPHKEPRYSEITHGWTGPHYYEHHVVNHVTEIQQATSDYILFTDADCRIISQPEGQSWVNEAIRIIQGYPEVLIVAPSDGGHEFTKMLPDGARLTQTVSQQIFIGERNRLAEMNFTNLQWDGQFDAPYGPFPEFYVLFEGWMWRWMRAHGLYRAVLPEQFRYWHSEWH